MPAAYVRVSPIANDIKLDPVRHYDLLDQALYQAHVNGLAEGLGLLAWTCDPAVAATSAIPANDKLALVWLQKGAIVNNISVLVTTGGSGVTAAQMGIYDTSLNRLAVTVNNPTPFSGTGWMTLAITGGYTVPATGPYYLAYTAAASVTRPTVLLLAGVSNAQALPSPVAATIKRHILGAAVSAALPNPETDSGASSQMILLIAS